LTIVVSRTPEPLSRGILPASPAPAEVDTVCVGFMKSLAPVAPAVVPAVSSACVASSTIPACVVLAFGLPPAST